MAPQHLPPGLKPVANPPNPFASTDVEYLDEVMGEDGPERATPYARLQVIEDSTRSILATNDSPDVGFDWSVNPYRGCWHACSYCMDGDTPIFMADGTRKSLRDVQPDDVVMGTEVNDGTRRYVASKVLAHWQTVKPAYRVSLVDGTQVVASGEHRFLTRRGWRHVTGGGPGDGERPHLTSEDVILGAGTSGQPSLEADVDGAGSLDGTQEDATRVVSVEPLGFDMLMFDITTSTSDFIANGVVSHNCYARPGHEYLSLGAGTDFDRIIVVKPEAPALLREAFDRPSWKGSYVMFSGVTDCYQPLEASYRVTRGCLEVCAEYRNPCGIITKAPLVERDLDVFEELSRVTDFSITMSIPFWDPDKARAIEPYVATPQRRMRTVAALAKRGIKVGVNVAPLIPGLGDEDVPAILKAASEAGAVRANFVYLRLPGAVATIFPERLRAAMPLRAEKILSRVREARGGKLYDSRWGARQVGEGKYAEAAMGLFEATARRYGLESGCASKDASKVRDTFRRPPKKGDQLGLFGDRRG